MDENEISQYEIENALNELSQDITFDDEASLLEIEDYFETNDDYETLQEVF